MAIVNQRWPRDIAPERCTFGRTRNASLLVAPSSRAGQVVERGRPLWRAELGWRLPNTDKLAKLRYWLESLEGFVGSAQVWDFTSPYPHGVNVLDTGEVRITWVHNGLTQTWVHGITPYWWVAGGSVPLVSALAVGASTLTFAGLQAGALLCLQGQYVQVGRRLYLAAASTTVAGDGTATVTLASPLIEAASAGEAVRFNESACEMRLASQDWDASSSAGEGLVSVSATFIEVV